MDFAELKKYLKKNPSGLPSLKIAVLCDFASQFFVQALRGYGLSEGFYYDVFEADYDQVERQVMDPNSDLYHFQPSLVLILKSTEKLQKEFYRLSTDGRKKFSETVTEQIERLSGTVFSRLNAKVIINTYPEINDSVFGNFSTKISSSFPYQVKGLNLSLMDLSQRRKDLYLADFSSIIASVGLRNAFDAKMYIQADMVFNLDILPILVKNVHDIIQALSGKFKKCVIIDLDNTIWGGIIGDDGIEGIQIGDLGIGKAYTNLQRWLKELKDRGILLAVCSKNEMELAMEPFQSHPDMILKLEDIAIFIANWENKVDNINHIRNLLNISFDSIVFLDDNPFEREMVKKSIPDITVPDLPEDPAEYLTFLQTLNLFETSSFTNEDKERTHQYQVEAKRSVLQQTFTNEDEFLESLNMRASAESFSAYTIPRVAQLSQRSNQFNLRTIRYTQEEVSKIANSSNFLTVSFTLEDSLGSYGLISAIILEKRDRALFIDTWIMSCRVLKRTMENYVLNAIVGLATANGFERIVGEYIPTAKNGLVKDHYAQLGFSRDGDKFVLDIAAFTNKKTFIKPI